MFVGRCGGQTNIIQCLVVSLLDETNEGSLSQILSRGGVHLHSKVSVDALDGGLVHAHLALLQSRSLGASPREENELGAGGVVVGLDDDLQEAVLALILLQLSNSLRNTAAAGALDDELRGAIIAEHDPITQVSTAVEKIGSQNKNM